MRECVVVVQADNRLRCARARENDTPPEAGPQQRVGFQGQETQRIGRAGGSMRTIIFAPSTLASRSKAAKTLSGATLRATSASTAVPLAWVPKNSKLLWEKAGGLGGTCGILQIGR